MTLNPESATNISSLPKEHCFGCGVCSNICPVDCITMTIDLEGFYYPQVDETICIACRKCVQACPGFNDIDREAFYQEPQLYGGQIEDEAIRMDSSSGGFFTPLAAQILSQGGSVYGAIYDFEKMGVIHSRTTNQQSLHAMRKSKYVQSDTKRVFKQVKQDLRSGMPVLFSGTPCQVEGLHLYLGDRDENLLTIDLVCHGVPSPGLFSSHFSAQEDKLKSPISNINFRTKDKGWGSFLNFFLKIETDDQELLRYAPLDAYYAIFLANLSLRPVCYICKYANTNRVADVTLGDFWGVQKEQPELFDGKGTSLILANTEKGELVLVKIQDQVKLRALKSLDPLPPNLVKPTPKPPLRDSFLTSIRFDRWENQRIWKHILALGVLVGSKLIRGFKKILNLK